MEIIYQLRDHVSGNNLRSGGCSIAFLFGTIQILRTQEVMFSYHSPVAPVTYFGPLPYVYVRIGFSAPTLLEKLICMQNLLNPITPLPSTRTEYMDGPLVFKRIY